MLVMAIRPRRFSTSSDNHTAIHRHRAPGAKLANMNIHLLTITYIRHSLFTTLRFRFSEAVLVQSEFQLNIKIMYCLFLEMVELISIFH